MLKMNNLNYYFTSKSSPYNILFYKKINVDVCVVFIFSSAFSDNVQQS